MALSVDTGVTVAAAVAAPVVMSDQCKVSKPPGLADNTEGEETKVKSLVSPPLWHILRQRCHFR